MGALARMLGVMQRLSTLDASFVHVETESAHMHVGWLSTLELPEGVRELDAGALAERMAARLYLAPRFRQRVAPAPVGDRVWVDEPSFRIADHVRVAGRAPRGRRETESTAGEFPWTRPARAAKTRASDLDPGRVRRDCTLG